MIPSDGNPSPYVHDVPVPPELAAALSAAVGSLEAARSERDRLIVEAHERGASLREISEFAGITHVAVFKIVRNHTNT